ncbi:hypothetical protein AXX17_ATUG03710 (mitochondrion) [Arabidopsis thaliana]|uniref:Uncharacterized protein n=1 Tax=Arabidopsis thaliana TaxID=3702 RepID=A0A178U923_ARATH|nr:hypothetical protein AXX17_ATUG03710 [Arabidopsis thaliana]
MLPRGSSKWRKRILSVQALSAVQTLRRRRRLGMLIGTNTIAQRSFIGIQSPAQGAVETDAEEGAAETVDRDDPAGGEALPEATLKPDRAWKRHFIDRTRPIPPRVRTALYSLHSWALHRNL